MLILSLNTFSECPVTMNCEKETDDTYLLLLLVEVIYDDTNE